MNYIKFHLLFNAPVAVVLLFLPPGPAVVNLPALGAVLAIVMVFTIPWDNYAAACGIWGFPTGKYALRIGYLPVEEYLFFVLQTLVVVLLTARLHPVLSNEPSLHDLRLDRSGFVVSAAIALCAIVLVGVLWGRRFGRDTRWHYAWHLLYWFGAVLVFQWVLAWPLYLDRLSLLAVVTIAAGTYYSLADFVAIRAGVWTFDDRQVSGLRLGGKMPWEEAAFFYLTSLIVSQSYLLFLPQALR